MNFFIIRSALALCFFTGVLAALPHASWAEDQRGSDIELPLRVILEFDENPNFGPEEKLVWDHLQSLNLDGVFSDESPLKYSDADLVVFKIDGWQAIDDAPGADNFKLITKGLKGNKPDATLSISIVTLGTGKKQAIQFINAKAINATPECIAKTIYVSAKLINPDWDNGSDAFDFKPSSC